MWKCKSDVHSPVYYHVIVDDHIDSLPVLSKSKDILARCYCLLLAKEPYQLNSVSLIEARIDSLYQHPDVSYWTSTERQEIITEVQNQLMINMESNNHDEEVIWSYVLAMLILKDLIDHPSASQDDGDDLFSPKQAITYLKYAAAQKFPLAVYDYAMLCIEGKKFYHSVDLVKAKEMLELCLQIDPKHRLAQYQLAELYFHGDGGVERNLRLAVQYYHEATEALLPEACFRLGVLAFQGYKEEVKPAPMKLRASITPGPKPLRILINVHIGLEYLCRAAELGHKEALFMVGQYYFKPPANNVLRKEVTRLPGMQSIINLKTFGLHLIKLSAELGHGQAEYAVSEIYFDGDGVEKDLKKSMAALNRL